jgi:hypothetical protein
VRVICVTCCSSTVAELARLRTECVESTVVASVLEVFKREREENIRTNSCVSMTT